ncbi:MAG: hypothetical protein CO105_11380 [Comamonadaceae bacterium CG_4_9_14_3_um_filter_60_33]|nr:MAG: hypothetical protein CO105_11380 [Comamonadaceae bacterium CG_4_9_14_3_um_filter_60_33]
MCERYQADADVTDADETAGRCTLLRVLRPLRGLLLYLRKAHRPTVLMSLSVCLQGKFEAKRAIPGDQTPA